MKEEGTPFKIVADSMRDTKKVINTPRTITQVSRMVASKLWAGPVTDPIKNMVIIAIKVGNAPPSKRQLRSIRRVDG